MNRSYSKLRHIQNINMLLENRFISEQNRNITNDEFTGTLTLSDALRSTLLDINQEPANLRQVEYFRVNDIKDGRVKTGTTTEAYPNPKKGVGVLLFNRKFDKGTLNVNMEKNYTIEDEINSGDRILAMFDKNGGMVSGTLYKMNQKDSDPFAEASYTPVPLTLGGTMNSTASIDLGQ